VEPTRVWPAGVLVLIDRASAVVTVGFDIAEAAREAGLCAGASPQGFTLSADSRWAFVPSQGIDRVAVVDLATREVVRFLPTGAAPDGIDFTPVRGR
jgi:DNA-binding beta-propeller fold protein YncE